jgi:hypothetical protein
MYIRPVEYLLDGVWIAETSGSRLGGASEAMLYEGICLISEMYVLPLFYITVRKYMYVYIGPRKN